MTHAGNPASPWPAAAPARNGTPAQDGTPPVTGIPDTATVTMDTGRAWLRNAMAALAVLAAAAAVVSWDAQYVLVRQVKHTRPSPRWRQASPTPAP